MLGTSLHYHNCCGMIVETEAYKEDGASHAVTRPNQGRLLRTTFGCLYIYLIYGMHYCLNITAEKNGVGAVLIRAIEPTGGLDEMRQRRNGKSGPDLTNGPGKLFQALGLDPAMHGREIGTDLRIYEPKRHNSVDIASSPRIGISRDTDLLWRFYIRGNPFVSVRKSNK